ncbi:MAG: flagellar basal body P-ring protein FlgI [Leptospiraceae bacterium]|nr:flagellar basal body P-ring protein FlgI [Leptospiraceae bacterium]
MTVIKPSAFIGVYLCSSVVIFSSLFSVEVKLKDISRIQGLRDNQITGYGIVTGLSGTGDTKSAVTNEAMKNYLKNQGLGNAKGANITRNIASVLITATIPSHARVGDKIDVTIASIGDARSLEGGVLIQSPLKGANNEVVAVASGVLSFGGKDNNRSSQPYNATSYLYGNTANVFTGSSHTKNSPKTVGTIVAGAIVEKEMKSDFFQNGIKDNKEDSNEIKDLKYRIILENQDFATLDAVRKQIKEKLKIDAIAVSPTEIEVSFPKSDETLTVLASIENLQVTPDGKAKVVINERTGTIVMGANVTVDEVAISKQGINVIISNKKKDSDDTKVELISVIQEGTKVSDIVDALNKIGASTKDIIAILEGMKKAGALHAEVIVQ